MPDTLGAVVLAAKRAVVLELAQVHADLSLNHARQVFAKVPGIHVWENDGAGTQLGIATRGLSPNRSWEFNLRQSGSDIAADPFGYPEAYYSPPMEAVERIHVVRGAASLAFGPQFGGMVDFVLKTGAKDRALAGSFRQTLGAYGLFNTYTDLGGTKGKWNYFAFAQHRSADGWRRNSYYTAAAVHGGVRYRFNDRLSVGMTYTHSNTEQQQPGGLTDAQWSIDPRSSTRARNWMHIPWNVGALTMDWRPDRRTVVEAKVFGLVAERGSVGFVRAITVPDTLSLMAGAHAPRQVDRDAYRNLGTEWRVRRSFDLFSRSHEFTAGVRAFRAWNRRRQLGVGSTGSDADLTVDGAFARELDLQTSNAAVHMETLLRLSSRLSVVPGARVEHIGSSVEGRINATAEGHVDSGTRQRTFVLAGLGAQLQASPATVAYANFSEAFRPVLHGDLTPSSTTDLIDPNLRDARGYNADLGYRGKVGRRLTFDAGVFLQYYGDRIGSREVQGMVQRTNIGASRSRGLEVFAEWDILQRADSLNPASLTVFSSYAYVDARYVRWNDPAIAEDPTRNITDNRVENAPEHTLRSGFQASKGRWSMSAQLAAVGGVFTDAANTRTPNANANIGWLPGYVVCDVMAGVRLYDAVKLTVGVNNALDAVYATRRAGGYPGPGLLPGMGRQAFLTLAARF